MVLDVASEKVQQWILPQPYHHPPSITSSFGGKLALAHSDRIELWSDSEDKPKRPTMTLPPVAGAPRLVASSLKGDLLAYAGDNGFVSVMAKRGGDKFEPLVNLYAGPSLVRSLAFGPDGSSLAAVNLVGQRHFLE